MTYNTNKCKVTLIKGQFGSTNDLTIVNAARVSFDKESKFDEFGNLSQGDQKLLNYLASHNHWTPFSHVREIFAFKEEYFDMDWFIQSVDQEHMAGMVMAKGTYESEPGNIEEVWFIKQSLYGWKKLLDLNKEHYIFNIVEEAYLRNTLSKLYPGATTALEMFSNTSVERGQYTPHHIVGMPLSVVLFDEHKRDYFYDVTLREEVPIFVARQRFKHMIGFTYNEVSRRYVDNTPGFFIPDTLRGRAENKKQGSTDDECLNHDEALQRIKDSIYYTSDHYEDLVNKDGDYKVCPEQARSILTQAMMTSYYVTGNLVAWKRMVQQRLDPHAQKEIQDYALLVQEILNQSL